GRRKPLDFPSRPPPHPPFTWKPAGEGFTASTPFFENNNKKPPTPSLFLLVGLLANITMFTKKKKRIEISAPSNFEHRVHTGYDQQEQKFTGLPRQWQARVPTLELALGTQAVAFQRGHGA
uniref:non-specific serine/threonine protein kinase n=1 Tax=Pseudonaja textilis TaxID=8673 RepID=A0A670YZD7_PSETE